MILEGAAIHLLPRGADDARVLRRLTGSEAVEEARDQLAPREIAGAAEYDEVERRNGNGFGDHG